jgi:hypothetical protein
MLTKDQQAIDDFHSTFAVLFDDDNGKPGHACSFRLREPNPVITGVEK